MEKNKIHLCTIVVFATQKLRDFGVAEMTETPINGRFMGETAGQLCAFEMRKGVIRYFVDYILCIFTPRKTTEDFTKEENTFSIPITETINDKSNQFNEYINSFSSETCVPTDNPNTFSIFCCCL